MKNLDSFFHYNEIKLCTCWHRKAAVYSKKLYKYCLEFFYFFIAATTSTFISETGLDNDTDEFIFLKNELATNLRPLTTSTSFI